MLRPVDTQTRGYRHGNGIEIVHRSDAVRPDNSHVSCGLDELALQFMVPGFGEAGCIANCSRCLDCIEITDGFDGACRRNRYPGGVRHAGQVCNTCDAGNALELASSGVDRPDFAVKPQCPAVANASGGRGAANKGYRTGPKKAFQVLPPAPPQCVFERL